MANFSPRKEIDIPGDLPRAAIAVLASGGLKSAILTAHLLDEFQAVYPIYVRQGLAREPIEERSLRRFLAAVRGPKLGRLAILRTAETEQPRDGDFEPVVRTAAAWCTQNGIAALAVASVEPGTFFPEEPAQLGGSVEPPAGEPVRLVAPFQGLSRASFLEFGRGLPLDLTFSCRRPILKLNCPALHCGQCLNCLDRRAGFAGLGIADRTRYAAGDRSARAVS